MTTRENLKAAFIAESLANRKYLAFARRAEQEGLAQIARLFRAAAHAETVHAMAHFNAMNGVGSTAKNLKEAIAEENFGAREIYPRYVALAMDEGAQKAMLSFNNTMEAEKVHHRLYMEALERVQSGEDLPPQRIYVCSICGNTVMGQPPEKCPVCGATREQFDEVQ